jgi:Mlc titration factor MtfA (ptsG expression regulator)
MLLLAFPILSKKSILKLKIVSPFYNYLSEKEQKKFRKRVAKFIALHRFIPKENVKIDKETKIMVASIAVMLTFKLNEFEFEPFENIIIYPKNYLSTNTNNHHKGETNPYLKTIVFSLEDFKEGIKVVDDNINLGIHEFTHALHLIMQRSKTEESYFFMENFKKIVLYFNRNKAKIQATNYIREYAFVNEHELLAVITENYFETPETFKKILPEVYFLLNQMYQTYKS